jgi:hypothetical protein
MSAVRRMKYEMTQGQREGRQAATSLEEKLDLLDVTDKDRAEVKRFAEFLKDSASMKLPELIDKHGADYLGFTPTEVEALKTRTPRL